MKIIGKITIYSIQLKKLTAHFDEIKKFFEKSEKNNLGKIYRKSQKKKQYQYSQFV